MTTATTPRERPIIMSAVSVRLILEGVKTQTRRAVKDERILIRTGVTNHAERLYRNEEVTHRCPYGRPGDRLWVREAWAPKAAGPYRFLPGRIWYRADPSKLDFRPKWRSPLFLLGPTQQKTGLQLGVEPLCLGGDVPPYPLRHTGGIA